MRKRFRRRGRRVERPVPAAIELIPLPLGFRVRPTLALELTVLCVDPDESARASTLERLRANADGVTLVAAGSLEAAADAVRERDVGCAVTEYDLPDGIGGDLVARSTTTTARPTR